MKLEKIYKNHKMKTILITGATSGLGLMLTRYYDSKGFNLISVGRDKKN